MNYEPGYKELAEVLQAALDQAQYGKGKDRHATDKPFLDQPMMTISRMSGVGGPIYQAMKKAQESMRLKPEAAIAECMGAINYLAGAILIIRETQQRELSAGTLVDDKTGLAAHGRTTASKLMDATIIGQPPFDAALPSITLACTMDEARGKCLEEFTEWCCTEKGTMEALIEWWDLRQAMQTYQEKGGGDILPFPTPTTHTDYLREGRPLMAAKAEMLVKNAERGYYAPDVNSTILWSGGLRFVPEPISEGVVK